MDMDGSRPPTRYMSVHRLHGNGPVKVLCLHGFFGPTVFDTVIDEMPENRFTVASICLKGYDKEYVSHSSISGTDTAWVLPFSDLEPLVLSGGVMYYPDGTYLDRPPEMKVFYGIKLVRRPRKRPRSD